MKIERDAQYFVAGFVSLAIFFLIMGFVLSDSARPMDYGVRESLVDSHSEFSDGFLIAMTKVFDNISLLVLFIAAFILLARVKLWKDGMLLGGSLLVAYAATTLFKLLVSRNRPFGALLDEAGYSFPSGHAVKVTLFMLLFIFLYTESIPSFIGRKFLITFGWLIIFLVCLSRLYFSVHWMSDVLAGFFLGLGIFCFAAWYRIRYNKMF